MNLAAGALAVLAFLSLFGVLAPAFSPNERGIFIMVGSLVLFGIFAGFAAVLMFNDGDA